jgi:integrase
LHSGEPRDVPITQNLQAILELRRHAPDGSEHGHDAYLFGDEFGARVKYWRIREAWRTTCGAASIQGVNFHDLRRTAASTMRASGAPDHVVRDWLGHADISTTSRYLKASRTEIRKYTKNFERRRAASLAKPTTTVESSAKSLN